MKGFNFTPEFKHRAQKWGLFFSLVLSLGFNLSWNPQMVNIVRHEPKVHSVELAQTATPAAAGDKTEKTENKPGTWTNVDLSAQTNDERMKGMIISVYNQDGCPQSVRAVVKKKTETEATTEGCSLCGAVSLKPKDACTSHNTIDPILVAIGYATENKDKLIAEAKKAKKDKDKDDSSDADDKCEGKKGTRLVDCQMDVYKALATSCSKKNKDDKDKKADDCDKRLDKAFGSIETAFTLCTKSRTTRKSDTGFGDSAGDIDCDNVEDFVKDELLSNSPTFSHVTKGLKFLNKRTSMEMGDKQDQLKALGYQPFQINQLMAMELDKTMGTQPIFNMQTGKWQVSSVPVGQVCTGFGACTSTEGREIYESVLDNPNFSSERNARNAFEKYLYGPFATARTKFITNPSATTLQSFDSAGLSDITAAMRGTQTSVPAVPGMVNRAGGTVINQTNGFLTPAQRGLISPSGRITQ